MTTVFTEGFEGAGYDETIAASWVEEAGTGCSVDEDEATVARPTGGGDQCLELVFANTGNDAQTYINLGSNYTTSYGRIYFAVSTWSSADNVRLFRLMDSSTNPIFTMRLNVDGGNKLEFLYRNNAGTQTVSPATTYSVNTWYICEWWYYQPGDANDTLCVRISGEDGSGVNYVIGTNATTPQALSNSDYGATRILHIGETTDRGYVGSLYFDLIEVNDGDGWIGSESGGATQYQRAVAGATGAPSGGLVRKFSGKRNQAGVL